MKLLTALICAIVLAAFTTPVSAEEKTGTDPARLEAAKELMVVMKTQEQFAEMLPTIARQMIQLIEHTKPELKGKVGPVINRIVKDGFIPRKNEMAEGIANIYALRFSADDLRKMIRFFKTPVGKRLVNATPELAKASMAFGRQWGANISKKLMARTREELKKEGHNL